MLRTSPEHSHSTATPVRSVPPFRFPIPSRASAPVPVLPSLPPHFPLPRNLLDPAYMHIYLVPYPYPTLPLLLVYTTSIPVYTRTSGLGDPHLCSLRISLVSGWLHSFMYLHYTDYITSDLPRLSLIPEFPALRNRLPRSPLHSDDSKGVLVIPPTSALTGVWLGCVRMHALFGVPSRPAQAPTQTLAPPHHHTRSPLNHVPVLVLALHTLSHLSPHLLTSSPRLRARPRSLPFAHIPQHSQPLRGHPSPFRFTIPPITALLRPIISVITSLHFGFAVPAGCSIR